MNPVENRPKLDPIDPQNRDVQPSAQRSMWLDGWIALGLGIIALICYVRTLAPDVLYGDSAEFQALSYTMGIAHTTGYPVYVLLGKILGTLLPFGNFAYRINLLSAIYAAGTLSGMYLLGRFITRSRVGPVLGAVAMGVAYSFWSQAVIAEVYTLATLVLTWSVYCLWRWQEDPYHRGRWVLATMLLLGLGVHTVVELVVPAVGIFILWTLWVRRASAGRPGEVQPARAWGKAIGMAVLGGAMGAIIFFGGFFLSDSLINPPTSFLNVALLPSRSLWGASTADLDTFFKRVYNTVVSLQWGKQLFSGDPNFMLKELSLYGDALIKRDFTGLMLSFGLLGLLVSLIRRFRLTGFVLLSALTLLFYIVNYKVSSKFVFYMATYLFICTFMGVGVGFVLEEIKSFLSRTGARAGWLRIVLSGLYLVAVLLAAAVFIVPAAASRWDALAAGKATFFKDDDYTYPLKDLSQPRSVSAEYLRSVPDNALLLMDWRALYTTAYLANVEQYRPNISFREASPFPSKDLIPESLLQEVRDELYAGRPVYIERMLDNVRDNFRTRPVAGSRLIQLLIK